MSTGRAALQVGILVFLGSVLFISGYLFFKHTFGSTKTSNYSVTFVDAQGITKGADVDFSGVQKGSVDNVGLDSSGHAILHMSLDKSVRIPRSATVEISSSLLGGSAVVEIMPPTMPETESDYYAPGAVITGQESLSLDRLQSQAGDLMAKMGGLVDQVKVTTNKANGLIDQATQLATSLNKFVSDPQLQGDLKQTVSNIDAASAQGLALTGQIKTMLAQDNELAKQSLGHVNSTTAEMDQIVQENHAKITQMMSSLNQTTSQLSDMMTQTNKILTQGHTIQNLSDTMASFKDAAVKLNQIEDDLRTFTGDPTVQKNIRTTINNAAEASAHTNELIARLDTLAGGRGHHIEFKPTTQLVFLENLNTHNFRTDFDLYAPIGTTNFARVGVRDLTESNRLNLQYGVNAPYNNRVSYRAGIYDSKIGVGADYDVFGPRHLSIDLYDPNDLKVDIRQRLYLTKQSALWLGLEDVPRENQVTVGFELHP